MVEIISTLDLKLGMFVAELDRPWLDSPFLIQGFLIDEEDQLIQLRELCRFVTIDRARSVGAEYRADPVTTLESTHHGAMPRAMPVVHYQGTRKLAIPPLVTSGTREVAGRKFSAVRYVDDLRVEDHLPAATTSYTKAKDLIEDIGGQVMAGKVPDIEHVDRTVDGLVECVVRNPDTLLWLSRLKRSDSETYDHALSVSIHLMAFGRHLGMPPDDLHSIGMGGLLMDIGFLRLPVELVHKTGGLAPDERARMREHVQLGVALLAEEQALDEVVRGIIAKHHERIDGSGYPARMRGADIGLHAEMAGIVDSYCAMLYPRTFRPARNAQWVIEEINSMRDQRFSPAVVDEFVQFVGIYPVGTLVELNSDEVGVVFEQNRVRRLKPRILVLLGPDKSRNPSPGILNLLNEPMVSEGVPYRIVRTLPSGSYGLDPAEYYL